MSLAEANFPSGMRRGRYPIENMGDLSVLVDRYATASPKTGFSRRNPARTVWP
ncbi:MAG: hypothetical protein WA957_08680 [Alteraurantiacibacter sp.]